jgi:UDP-2,4-diacetamido-2,4,6-trideoxy-beta-L-altropyranose hydrolase
MGGKMEIIFRADGNAETGLGHLFRLFAIVEMIKDDYKYTFFTKFDSTKYVIPENYNYKILPKEIGLEQEPSWFVKDFNPEETIVIADGYHFNSAYQKKIKENGFKLIYVDDLVKEYMYADLVINHSPHVKISDFISESYTKYAIGSEYAILRPSFLNAAKKLRVIDRIDTAFVCFGGADYYDLTSRAVEALLQISSLKNIHVVLGGAYQHSEIFKLENKYCSKIKIYQNLSETELLNVMLQCNFAIVPASTILYEIMVVKMVVFTGYFVENQVEFYRALRQKKVFFGLGDLEKFDFKNISEKIYELTEKNIQEQLTNQKRIIDGEQKKRFLQLLYNINLDFNHV